MTRDKEEKSRLESLNNTYTSRTKIEEQFLEQFVKCCSSAMNEQNVYDKLSLPTKDQVIYLELIDKWAIWLDDFKWGEFETEFKKLKNDVDKQILIANKFKSFTEKYPIGAEIPEWIDSPQSLLTIGIIQMHHNEGFHKADETFDKLLQSDHMFAGEAFYYKACLRIKDFSKMRKSSKSLQFSKSKNSFEANIDKTVEYFYKARTAFVNRQNKIQYDAALVAKLIQKLPTNQHKVFAFKEQIDSKILNIKLLIENIDYLIGSPCNPTMFESKKIKEEDSKKIYESLTRRGIISPLLLVKNEKNESWQIDSLRQKFKLTHNQIEVTFIYFLLIFND
jgi:hypothetical protein